MNYPNEASQNGKGSKKELEHNTSAEAWELKTFHPIT